MRTIVDSLTFLGDPILASHHIYAILEGLPFKVAPTTIESKFGLLDLDEVEILLLAHELRLRKFKKFTYSRSVVSQFDPRCL